MARFTPLLFTGFESKMFCRFFISVFFILRRKMAYFKQVNKIREVGIRHRQTHKGFKSETLIRTCAVCKQRTKKCIIKFIQPAYILIRYTYVHIRIIMGDVVCQRSHFSQDEEINRK